MADITSFTQGNVSDEGKVNWRSGDSAVVEGDQSVYDTSTVPLAQLGQVKVVGDRVFRYAQANGTMAPGQLTQINVPLAAVTAGNTDPAGGKQITYFFSSAAASGTKAANFYAEGYVLFSGAGTSTQMGMQYRVKSHPVITTSGNVILSLYEPLKYSVLTTDDLVLIQNPFQNLIANGTGAIYCPGICPVNCTTGDYFWLQTGGPALVQMATSVPIQGTPLSPGTSGVAISFPIATITSVYGQTIGYSMAVATSGLPSLAWLTIEQ